MLLDLRSLYERLAAQEAGQVACSSGVSATWSFTANPTESIAASSSVAATWKVTWNPTELAAAALSVVAAAQRVTWNPQEQIDDQAGVEATYGFSQMFAYAGAIAAVAGVSGSEVAELLEPPIAGGAFTRGLRDRRQDLADRLPVGHQVAGTVAAPAVALTAAMSMAVAPLAGVRHRRPTLSAAVRLESVPAAAVAGPGLALVATVSHRDRVAEIVAQDELELVLGIAA